MKRTFRLLAGALALAAAPLCAHFSTAAARAQAALAANVHPLARPEFEIGPADAQTRLDRMILLLRPSPESRTALNQLLAAQQDPVSAEFHHWLTPAEFEARFGVPPAERARAAAWLAREGFTVAPAPAGGQLILFSGTAAQVEAAFHPGLRRYRVDGAVHLANSLEPEIPAELASTVAGIVSLHDFRHRAASGPRRRLAAAPAYDLGGSHYLLPADYATIYNFDSLYVAGVTGAGESIAIAGRSNILPADVAAFRAFTGLAANPVEVTIDGADPGLVTGDEDEATLDVEWAGATGRGATVKLVAAASTATTDGIDLASAAIVGGRLAPVVSLSYGSCERAMGAAELAFYNALWKQAAAEGMSVLVASGDSGAAGCTSGWSRRSTEAGVNGLCSSPYSTCVGGTEFDEGSNPSKYWSAANNASDGSAVGYIPETVWNESGANGGQGLWASGGGVSRIYAQPSWQKGVEGAAEANGMRAVPDLAMTAAAHDGSMIYENGSEWIVSGTSAAAPSLAGLAALLVQSSKGAWQGNLNPGLYALLNAPVDPFHHTLSGSNAVPGVVGFTAAGQAYNLATGLGSVDASLLVEEWAGLSAPMLALRAATAQVALPQGESAVLHFTVSTGGNFDGTVALAISGLPAGVKARWSANPVAPGTAAVTLRLGAAPNAVPGSARITAKAAGSGLTASQTIAITVLRAAQPLAPPR